MWEWRLPGAIAGMPALRMSGCPACPRSAAVCSGTDAMSRAVVTPWPASAGSRAGPSRCTCASIRPGSSTPPAPSMTCAPAGSVPIRPPAMTTELPGTSCRPSNTRTFVRMTFPPSGGPAGDCSWLAMEPPRSRCGYDRGPYPVTGRRAAAGHYLQVDARGIGGPPGDVLIRADQQELIAPRVVPRRLAQRQRNAEAASAAGQGRGGCRAAPHRAQHGKAGAEMVVEGGAVGQPGVRQPRARVGARRVAGWPGGRTGAGGRLDDRRARIGIAEHEAEAVKFRPLRLLDRLRVSGQVAGQSAHVGLGARHRMPHDAAALVLVAGQQRRRGPPVLDGGDLPGDVHRVADAGVEPVPAPRRVDVRALADQEHPAP